LRVQLSRQPEAHARFDSTLGMASRAQSHL
jgi:hypothetical protein